MNISDYYFIPQSSWNINSIFTTESISPHFFFSIRMFGTSRNTLTTDVDKKIQFENCLLLYPSVFKFQPLKGSPVFIAIRKESLIKDKYLIVENGLVYCFKTIYLKRDSFFLCVPNEEIKQFILADASPSIEVKTIKKYLVNKKKSNFLIIADDSKLNKLFNSPEFYFPEHRLLDQYSKSQPFIDKAFNHIKGFIYGLLGGTVGGKDDNQIKLEKSFQELQNEITSVKGRVEIAKSFNPDIFVKFCTDLNSSKTVFQKIYPKDNSSNYDTISLYINELVDFLKKRFDEISRQENEFTGLSAETLLYLSKEKENLENSKKDLQYSFDLITIKVDKLEEKRKSFGRKIEYKSIKEDIKNEISDLKEHKSSIKEQISTFSKKINSIQFRLSQANKYGRSDYDGNIEDIYYKITSLLSDIMFSVNLKFVEKRRKLDALKLSKYKINIDKLSLFWYNKLSPCNDDYIISIDESESMFDSSILFKIIINTLLENSKCTNDIPESLIDNILNTVIERLKNEKNTKEEVSELDRLLNYRSTKNFEYIIPAKNETLKNFIAFIFKPSSVEELQRFLFSKNISHQYIAYSFWGTFNGFAAMPKTFTDTIFESELNSKILDEIDNYLFANYINKTH
jgi:hypothetical protein